MPSIEGLGPERVSEPDPGPEHLSLDDASPLLDALSSTTARAIVVELRDDPATATALADRVGTSLQNVCHHLSQLTDVGLVTVVGTRYSEKGREMNVYAPAVTSLVIHGTDVPEERE